MRDGQPYSQREVCVSNVGPPSHVDEDKTRRAEATTLADMSPTQQTTPDRSDDDDDRGRTEQPSRGGVTDLAIVVLRTNIHGRSPSEVDGGRSLRLHQVC